MYRPVESAIKEERRRIIAGIATAALALAIAGFVIGIVALCRQVPAASSSTPIPALSFKGEIAEFVSIYTGCVDVTPRFTSNVSAYVTSDGKSATVFVEADTTPFLMTLPGGCSPPIVVGASIPVLGSLIQLPVTSCGSALGFADSAPTLFLGCVQTGNALSLTPLVNGSLAWTAGVTYAPPATWTMAYLINNL